MLGHWYTLLLRRLGVPVSPYRELLRLSSPITTTVALSSPITRAVTLASAIDIEDTTP
jgi:hypothetical protein